ncbi:AMP-binding protein [Streptomyces sp. NPDC046853]|uniref:AMP-binding protein n=1 Tax=Streptomyces sp. NPDC046853 TaxID=3154920 RepID=UPI0033DF9801
MPQQVSEVSGHPHSGLIHESVAYLARTRPDAVALVHGVEHVTYGELDRIATAYAAALHARGVGPGQYVPVLMDRTVRYVAAVLGVLTCGAAYATLDRQWPRERLRRIVASLRAPLIVADAPVASPVPVWIPGAPGPAAPPRAGSHPDDAATVFFTSGTTGDPKGVVAPHRATTRLFGPDGFADFGPGHVTVSAAALHWDAASLEIWGPLTTGGTVVLAEDRYFAPSDLSRMVRDHGVDTLWLTASLFNAFVDEDLAAFRGVRHVLTGGERLSPHHVRAFLRAHPAARLTNGYGPVESCVFVTTHPVSPQDCGRDGGIPIGMAVSGTRVYVMDEGRLCRPGQVGEVCVGGDGLALGYIGDGSQAVVPFPTWRIGGQSVRVHATGDLGLWTEDGVLHYVGRADRQVKVRGHRIEPAAVEDLALTLPWVDKAVAVAAKDDDGAYRSLALFCAASTVGRPHDAANELRTLLARQLPPFSVPDRIELVDAIPLTAQGKADARALLALPPTGRDAAAAVPEAAAGDLPPDPWHALALSEFNALLGPGAHATSTLTSLGGTSLDAIRLCSRLSGRGERPVSVARFLRDPTPAGLARLLAEARQTPPARPAPRPRTPGVPLFAQQAGFVLRHELDPSDAAEVCPLLWHVRGPLDIPALERALNDVQRRHEALRSAYRFTPDALADPARQADELRVQLPEPGIPARSADEARSRVEQALLRPFDLGRADIWRCVYVPVDEQEGCLGIAVHHAALDAWSQELLVSDLARAYRARLRGRLPRFHHPAPTLRQVYEEHRQATLPDGLGAQTAYWANLLRDVPDLPGTRPGSGDRASLDAAEFVLGPDVGARIHALAVAARTTDFVPLLACYATAVARATGQRDFGIGVPVVRRPGPYSLRAVSCLIDVLCLRLPPADPDGPVHASLPAVRRAVTEAFRHQEAPFSHVVRAVAPLRTGRNPLFQTMFAYQNTPPARLELGNCTVTPHRVMPREAMQELTCEVWPLQHAGMRVEIRRQSGRHAHMTATTVADHYRSLLMELSRFRPLVPLTEPTPDALITP